MERSLAPMPFADPVAAITPYCSSGGWRNEGSRTGGGAPPHAFGVGGPAPPRGADANDRQRAHPASTVGLGADRTRPGSTGLKATIGVGGR